MSLSEYKARRHKEDPDWIDPEDYKTEEEYSAAMDRKWPRLAEPDEEGIDLNPADPRRRFIAIADGTTFRKADPLTEEDLAELEAMKAALFGSPEKKEVIQVEGSNSVKSLLHSRPAFDFLNGEAI